MLDDRSGIVSDPYFSIRLVDVCTLNGDLVKRIDTWLCGQEGSAKMSKSAELDASRINLLDSPKDVQNKIKRAKTDAGEGLEYDNPERPEARNLLTLYALATGHSLVS